MSYSEKDIAYEAEHAWVLTDKKNGCYTVFKNGVTHSTSDSAYPLTDDGLSIAKARADYITRVTTFANGHNVSGYRLPKPKSAAPVDSVEEGK